MMALVTCRNSNVRIMRHFITHNFCTSSSQKHSVAKPEIRCCHCAVMLSQEIIYQSEENISSLPDFELYPHWTFYLYDKC